MVKRLLAKCARVLRVPEFARCEHTVEATTLFPRHCERSEAIHSAASGKLDCFAALAMTAVGLRGLPHAWLATALPSAACAAANRAIGTRYGEQET